MGRGQSVNPLFGARRPTSSAYALKRRRIAEKNNTKLGDYLIGAVVDSAIDFYRGLNKNGEAFAPGFCNATVLGEKELEVIMCVQSIEDARQQFDSACEHLGQSANKVTVTELTD